MAAIPRPERGRSDRSTGRHHARATFSIWEPSRRMTDSHGYTKPLYDTATPKRRTCTPPRQKLLVELDRFITAAKTRKYPKSNVQTIVRKGSCAYWTNRRLIIAGL